MLERARALAATLRERAEQTEALRRIPDDTLADLHRAGLFRIVQPRRVGGSEFDYVALIDFAAALAQGDSAVAWNVANLGSHHWMLAMFDPRAQARVWGENPDALIASSFVFPCGRARAVDGGYRISGRWPFSSGVTVSQWNMLGGVVSSDADFGAAEYRIFLVAEPDYRVEKVWDALGLSGTGSEDVVIDDLFVPAHMTLGVSEVAGGPTPGSAANPNVLYQLPVFALFPYVLAGVALGNAEACLADFVASARKRASSYNLAKMADFQSIQIRIGAASARIDAARGILRGACLGAMEDARAGRLPDMARRTAYRRDGAYAVNLCTEAVDILFKAAGAGGLFRKNALQRQFREAHAIDSHIAFSFDAAGANYGRVALGLPSENPTL
ncbi:MAG: acyl-CoA dehydrogenase family protein [Hyphomicrobiales bacterium]|nr:acyl-CoA dehydrogenase family protein [Hyphomicrobiales bacterium]